jgi:malonate transporter and related proteins
VQALIDVILPVFLLIAFGYAAARARMMGEATVDGVMTFAQTFAAPCLLFRSIATLDLAQDYSFGLMTSFYIGAFASFAAGFFGARHLFGRTPEDAVAVGFCCLFSNSLLLGVPITERAYGTAALAGNFAIISIHAPVFYAFGITLMEVVRSRGMGLSVAQVARQVITGILRQPLVIGILCGFAVNLMGNPLPKPVWDAAGLIAATALPTALFALGGVLVRYRPEGDRMTIAMVVACSLILHPAIGYALARFGFGIGTDGLRSVTVTAAMAPGVNAYVFANMYGTARRVAASSVLVGTAVSIVTAWFWLGVLP